MSSSASIDLKVIVRQLMLGRGFRVDFNSDVNRETNAACEPLFQSLAVKDLSERLWSSIDNDDSRDLDQIELVDDTGGVLRILVAIADVSAFVHKDSATDRSAQQNMTSIYTGVETYPMLPERLSTNLSSLAEKQKRLAIVVEMIVNEVGLVTNATVYPAIVQNQAQLTYHGVTAWLDSNSHDSSSASVRTIAKIAASVELQQQLKLQDRLAQLLRQRRRQAGALDFERKEFRPAINNSGDWELSAEEPNRASQLVEEFMVAANEAVDAFLQSKQFPSVQRVVRTPKNWSRMMDLAREHGGQLPALPDGVALQTFLSEQRVKDPDRFADLSLAMVKLMGRGEYVVKKPGDISIGHFGLAAQNYSHSTAPNRRYADLLTQRLLQAVFRSQSSPYSTVQLEALAVQCTNKEDEANHIERQVHKSIAALALIRRVGEVFNGFITGSSDKGVWVRISNPPVEGKVEGQGARPEVGQHVQVRLTHTDPARGFIDFEMVAV